MGQEHTTTKQNETITGEYNKKTRTLYHHRITTNFQKIWQHWKKDNRFDLC